MKKNYSENSGDTKKNYKDALDDLSYDKVWVTKKIRMDAAERMRKKNDILNIIIIYYSACLAIMSILNLYDSTGLNISIFASIISFALPSANIFLYKADYNNKASQYTSCYLELEQLEGDIEAKSIKGNIQEDDYAQFTMKYNKIKSRYINHDALDYLLFCQKKDNSSLKTRDKLMIYFIVWGHRLFLAVLFLIPIILIITKLSSMTLIK